MAPVIWNTDAFRPGRTLLEEIEDFPGAVQAAILLATPDVWCTRRDEEFRAPVANVLFEYGYLGGRLTRDRVAVCRAAHAVMPSDADGVKLIEIGEVDLEEPRIPDDAVTELRRWLAGLPIALSGLLAHRSAPRVLGQVGDTQQLQHLARLPNRPSRSGPLRRCRGSGNPPEWTGRIRCPLRHCRHHAGWLRGGTPHRERDPNGHGGQEEENSNSPSRSLTGASLASVGFRHTSALGKNYRTSGFASSSARTPAGPRCFAAATSTSKH